MHVQRADRVADLADEQIGRTERRVVSLAPQQANATGEMGEIVEQRPPAAHLAAVESRPAHQVDLDVERLLSDARLVAQHVHEQVVAADLAKQLRVVTGCPVALRGAIAEATCREAAGRDQTEMGDPRAEATGQIGRDRPAEREPCESQRPVAAKALREQLVHEVEVGPPAHVARHGCRIAVARVIEGVDGEVLSQRVDVPDPVLPGSHPAVKQHDVGADAAPAYDHSRGRSRSDPSGSAAYWPVATKSLIRYELDPTPVWTKTPTLPPPNVESEAVSHVTSSIWRLSEVPLARPPRRKKLLGARFAVVRQAMTVSTPLTIFEMRSWLVPPTRRWTR